MQLDYEFRVSSYVNTMYNINSVVSHDLGFENEHMQIVKNDYGLGFCSGRFHLRDRITPDFLYFSSGHIRISSHD